jgi:hypothetical protein
MPTFDAIFAGIPRICTVPAWVTALTAALALSPSLPRAAGIFRHRDFSLGSAWNLKISRAAKFETAPGVTGLLVGLDTWGAGDAYTVPCYRTERTDALHHLLYNRFAWSKVARGLWQRSGNPPAVEAEIEAESGRHFPPPGNVFSSVSASAWVLPPFMQGLPPPPPQDFRFTPAMLPPSGTDGHMAVGQPSGRVVETYATILLSTGDVVALSYTLSNPAGLGDGHANGQTASMLPNYAGLIQDEEMKSGINHAMAVSVPAALLTPLIAAPAATFDRDALTTHPPYSGSLPMGARLALPPGTKLTLSTPEGQAIAKAAARYGFILSERGGSGITLHVRPNAPHQDPVLHSFNEPLQSDLNAIFAQVAYVPK